MYWSTQCGLDHFMCLIAHFESQTILFYGISSTLNKGEWGEQTNKTN